MTKDMATVTKYLERSMQNCSLSNRGRSIGDDLGMTDEHIPISDTFLKFNSHISMPSHLERCLDLKVKGTYSFFCFLINFPFFPFIAFITTNIHTDTKR